MRETDRQTDMQTESTVSDELELQVCQEISVITTQERGGGGSIGEQSRYVL